MSAVAAPPSTVLETPSAGALRTPPLETPVVDSSAVADVNTPSAVPLPLATLATSTLEASSVPSSEPLPLTNEVTPAGVGAEEPTASSPTSSPTLSPAPLARTIPHRRVKLYRLKDDQWIDLGTGNCTGLFIDPTGGGANNTTNGSVTGPSHSAADEGAWIVVSKEGTEPGEQLEVLLRSKVQSSGYGSDDENDEDPSEHDEGSVADAGRYQRQQDTLIVWTDRQTEMEMALSFATPAGCAEIWEFIKQARKWNADQALTSPSMGSSLSSPQPFPQYSTGITRLPEVTLANIAQVENAIRTLGRTASGREATASTIIKGGMIQKLIRIQEEAEDLESLEDLHAICRVMQTILLLNDNAIFELILRNEVILGVASILEYDPEFPTMKASYRSHLANASHFKQVVPIRSPELLAKIHQTHRLYYLKDVVLARILEESTFSMLNSAIYFNEVDIVNEVSSDADFLHELFAIFDEQTSTSKAGIGPQLPLPEIELIGPQIPTSTTTLSNSDVHTLPLQSVQDQHNILMDRQYDAIMFLQQFCGMAKNLQLALRAAFFRGLVAKGLLRVIEVALTNTINEGDSSMRSATIGILMNLVDHDPNNVRGYSLKQHAQEKRPLVVFLIELFQHEPDLGLKAQMAEALRVLVDAGGEGGPLEAPPRMRQEDPEAEKFLQYFYDHCALILLRPVLALPDVSAPNALLALSTHDIAVCCHICDLLCFFVTHHTFRSKFYVLSSPISANVAKLFKTRHKHLKLAALRYFRACIGKNDEFYNRFLIKNDLFRPVLDVAIAERGKDNLLASACLDFFELIRTSNIKAVLNHLMTAHASKVRLLAPRLETFSSLISRWEQNNEPPPPPAPEIVPLTATSKSMTRQGGSWSRMEMDEESYFNGSDDDDDASGSASVTEASGSRKRDDDEDQGGRKRVRVADPPTASGDFVRSQALSFQASSPVDKGKGKGLVDYGGDDDDGEQNPGGFIHEARSDAPELSSPDRTADQNTPTTSTTPPRLHDSPAVPVPTAAPPRELLPDSWVAVGPSAITAPSTPSPALGTSPLPLPIPTLQVSVVDHSTATVLPELGTLRRQKQEAEDADDAGFLSAKKLSTPAMVLKHKKSLGGGILKAAAEVKFMIKSSWGPGLGEKKAADAAADTAEHKSGESASEGNQPSEPKTS